MTAETSATIAVRTLHMALDDLDAEAQHAVDLADVEELAALHVDLTRAKRRLAVIAGAVEDALVDVMPDKIVEIPGLPPIELRSGARRTRWDTDAIVSALAREAEGDLAALLDSLMDCAPFTPSMGWRSTRLKAHGIDPDEVSETKPGRKTIQVHEDAVEAVAS